MKLTIDRIEPAELEHLMGWLRDNNLLDRVELTQTKPVDYPFITRGDKSLDPDGLRGIWKDSPRTLEEIRKASWRV
jgi:hypothetical protein